MKKKRESLLLGRILQKIAPRIGATVLMEPKWGIVGQIIFKNGRHSYLRYNTLDLNPMGGSEIARDKDYSNFFMKSMGYSIVPGSKTFYSDLWGQAIGSPRRNIDAAYKYAQNLGFPIIVKPNSGSQGVGVSLVYNRSEFYKAARSIFKRDRIMLVQKPVRGKDYRLVVLDKKIISAYERISPDGKPTQRYHAYRDHSRSKEVMGEALREAYADIFLIKAQPTAADRVAVEGKFKSFHNVSDNVAQLMAKTFFALLALADISSTPKPAKADKKNPDETPAAPSGQPPQGGGSLTPTGLHYNIQIHLPATKDIEVYNAIFKSLKEHLIAQ